MNSFTNFPGVIGHVAVQSILYRAAERNRLHHALMFVGPRGVGKLTLARGLACALLCPESPFSGCGTCTVCSRVQKGIHPDCTVISTTGKSQQIARESIQACVLNCQHAPFEAPAHVVVINPADRLTIEAANTLLKCLEEPPPGVYFVLLATNESTVLPTLTSRCLSIPIPALDDQLVRREVQRRLTSGEGLQQEEMVESEIEAASDRSVNSAVNPTHNQDQDQDLNLAVSLAQGSIGAALNYVSDPSWACTKRLLATAQQAVRSGAVAVFSGEQSELWQSWEETVLSVEDPEALNPETSPSDAVIKITKGKGKGKGKTKPKKANPTTSKSALKSSPARQRIAAMQLTDLWLLDLRKRMLGFDKSNGPCTEPSHSPSHSPSHRQMRILLGVQRKLQHNPNVRLTLEQMLLDLNSAQT